MKNIKQVLAEPHYMLYNMMYWVANSLYEPYIVVYMESRGLSSAQIGLVLGIMRVLTIVGSFAIGYASDRSRSPKLIIFLSSVGGVAAVFITGYGRLFPVLAVGCALYGFFAIPSLDIVDKLIVENVKNGAQLLGLFRMFGSLGYSLGALGAGALVAKFQYTEMFFWCNASLLVCVILCFFMHGSAKVSGLRENKVPLSKIFRNPISLYIYGCQTLWGCVEGGSLSYATLFLTDQGYSADLPAWFIAAAMLGQIAMFTILSMWIQDKMAPQRLMATAGLMVAARLYSYAAVSYLPLPLILLFQTVGGAGFSCFIHASVELIAASYPESVSSTAQTLKSVFYRGIGSSAGAIAFGFLYEQLPPALLMHCSTMLSVFYTIFSLILFHAVQHMTRTGRSAQS